MAASCGHSGIDPSVYKNVGLQGSHAYSIISVNLLQLPTIGLKGLSSCEIRGGVRAGTVGGATRLVNGQKLHNWQRITMVVVTLLVFFHVD